MQLEPAVRLLWPLLDAGSECGRFVVGCLAACFPGRWVAGLRGEFLGAASLSTERHALKPSLHVCFPPSLKETEHLPSQAPPRLQQFGTPTPLLPHLVHARV
eukprot:Transcript_19591.p6 GENE.Transcript_19591~~Transcript_19591.p6  ORF type:complete len:102 (+),score=6.60 Transcript_19591:932-1237(+)